MKDEAHRLPVARCVRIEYPEGDDALGCLVDSDRDVVFFSRVDAEAIGHLPQSVLDALVTFAGFCSVVSDRCWCASWMDGIEFTLYRYANGGKLGGQWTPPPAFREQLRQTISDCQGWGVSWQPFEGDVKGPDGGIDRLVNPAEWAAVLERAGL